MTPDEANKTLKRFYAGPLPVVTSPAFDKASADLLGPLETATTPIGRPLETPLAFRHLPRWRKAIAKVWLRVRFLWS
jgi:hypothetical protein